MDFFAQPCPPILAPIRAYAEVFAEQTSLPSLPQHTHQVLGAFAVYHLIYQVISPILSRLILPSHYNKFPRRTQVNWDVHVVSFIQSAFICALALWGMLTDGDRQVAAAAVGDEGALYRVFGYTVTGAAVQAYATGYFLWDLMISVYYVDIMGWGFVAHAVSALVVYALGFRPFVNYYAPIFILFELSSPFLNIHWFCDKLNLTGSIYQLVNGFFLLGTFFCCRILWGTYNSVLVFRDIFYVYAHPAVASPEALIAAEALSGEKMVAHPFAGMQVPLWLAIVYLGSNLTLNGLNYYWFSRMIVTVTARFTQPKKVKTNADVDEKLRVEGSNVDLATPAEIAGENARRRIKMKAGQ
ncbi:TLC domain-containing protein [Tricharina praecox]|uniref:TLC domain-containing protein n=1 Tax=Tricharina praecox TaxID=43433 RepID=UPI0022212332|nr:TLC domain-containing protein [Tricharina praecox]KAI5858739.1 TLC domain-containing protein [Tricharina praecox]